MIIKILGSGCKKCVTLGENAKAAADAVQGATRGRSRAAEPPCGAGDVALLQQRVEAE